MNPLIKLELDQLPKKKIKEFKEIDGRLKMNPYQL